MRGEGDVEVVEVDLLGVAADDRQRSLEGVGDDDRHGGRLVVDEEVEQFGRGWLGGDDDHGHECLVVGLVTAADEGVGPVVQGEGAVGPVDPCGEVIGEVVPGLLVGELGQTGGVGVDEVADGDDPVERGQGREGEFGEDRAGELAGGFDVTDERDDAFASMSR